MVVRSKDHAAAKANANEIIVEISPVEIVFQRADENCGELMTCTKPSGVILRKSEPSGVNIPAKKIAATQSTKVFLMSKTCARN